MGHFTEEMTRLVGEIVDLRGARKGFVKDLTHNTAALMASFHRAHRDMARKTKAERRAAVVHLKKTVAPYAALCPQTQARRAGRQTNRRPISVASSNH
jgi:molybdenum-dependent DNA-binding transcriptional regulator ModE